MSTVARLTAAWNIPHITYGGTSVALGNKTEFRTLTRLAYNLNKFAKFYMEVFRVSIVCGPDWLTTKMIQFVYCLLFRH